MPRRKSRGDDQLTNMEQPPLMLPPAHPRHRHEHDKDPYESPPGAVPGKASNVTTIHAEPKRRMSKEDLAARTAARTELRARATRYNDYLDVLAETGGNQITALASVYGVTEEEAKANRMELQADVRSGIGSTELAEVLERNDLSVAARTNLLRKHAYSNNPAASLKAIDMINETEGAGNNFGGSFEQYLRMAKASAK